MIIKTVDLIDPSTYKRTSEENYFFGTKIKRLIVESKIVNPKEKITVELIKDDSPNARIINVMTKSIVSQWEDIECKSAS